MSAFDDHESENFNCESNVPLDFCSPKVSEKDFSLIVPNSGDRSLNIRSPIQCTSPTLSAESLLNLSDSSLAGTNTSNNVVLEDSSACQGGEHSDERVEETDEQRREREDRESQELAWQLMQQDNMEMYNLQLQYMQENAGQLEDEDFQLMQALMNESGQQVQQINTHETTEEVDEEAENEEDELNESDSSNWDYDRLLQLGQQLGGTAYFNFHISISLYLTCLFESLFKDVKTERWRMKSKSVINSLPRKLYATILADKDIHIPTVPVPSTTAPTALVTVFQLPCASPVTINPDEEESAKDKEATSSNKKRCVRKEVGAEGPTQTCPCTEVGVGAGASTSPVPLLEAERCVVCMDDYALDEELLVFPCKHYFHIPCTEGWLAVR